MVNAVASDERLIGRRSNAADAALSEIDVDRDILWETAVAPSAGFYAWVAGEAAAVKAIRHILVNERGFERSSVSLMGYWRAGQVLD